MIILKKILIIYYSKTGHTRIIANNLHDYLKNNTVHIDIEEILEISPKSGLLGYLMDGKDAIFKKNSPIHPVKKNITDYDLIIIGTPVWAWTMSNPIRYFIKLYKNDFKKVAFFITMGGTYDKSIFLHMTELVEKNPIATFSVSNTEQNSFSAKFSLFKNKIIKSL